MEDSDEFKWAVKVVIKRQMRDLINQLKESGEEIAVMAVNLEDDSCSLLGTPNGEWFLSEQKNLSSTFVNFCKNKSNRSVKTSISNWIGTSSPQAGTSSTVQKTDGTRRYTSTPGRRPKHLIQEPNPTIIKITVPSEMASDMPEEELAALIGRLFAAKVVSGKVNTQSTRFDEIMDELALRDIKAEVKRRGGKMKTPSAKKRKLSSVETQKSTTRSGRKVSNKFLEGLNSLKKVKSAIDTPEKEEMEEEEEETNVDQETAQEESTEVPFNLLEELQDLDVMALKRFMVCTSDEEPINVLAIELAHLVEIEAVAGPLIQAIDKAVPKTTLLDMKKVQLIVAKGESDATEVITVEIFHVEDGDVGIDYSYLIPLDNQDEEDSERDSTIDQDTDKPAEPPATPTATPTGVAVGMADVSGDGVDGAEGNITIDPISMPTLGMPAGKVKQIGMTSSARKLIRRPKKRAATELMLMKCPECGISVTGKSNLSSHIKRIHLNVRNFECNICGKGFWSNNARESHMLAVHTRKCESCQEYVVESVPWIKGVDMKTKRDVICTCGSIVSIFSTFGRRRMYLRDDEPDEDGNIRVPRVKNESGAKFACGTCGKLFMKKSNCERHSRAHTEMKMCVCDICGNSYSYESSLKKHMQSEHGIMKHVCEICGGNYGNLMSLKVHMVRAHHNVAIGDDVAIIVKDALDDEDLREYTQSLQAKHMETSEEQQAHSIEAVSRAEDVTTKGQVYIQTSSGQFLMSTADAELLQEAENKTTEVQVHEQELSVGEGEQRVVISTEGEVISGDTTEIVQEVLRSGQLVAQEGAMSIIIKQVPMDSSDIQ